MRGIIFHLKGAFQRIFASPLSGFLSLMVIGVALSLPAGLYVLLKNANGIVEHLSKAPQINLYLDQDATTEHLEYLRGQLAVHPGVESIRFIDRDIALEELKADTGLSDVTGGLSQNPLPHTFVVYPASANATVLSSLQKEFSVLPKVQLAQLDSEWAYRLDALLQFGRVAATVLALLLSFALVAITFNTIRLQILTQRDEIEVSKLIGATNAFIRRPFLYYGAMQGLLGGILAWIIISIGLALLNNQLDVLSKLYSAQLELAPLSWGDGCSLILFSIYLGLLGAWLSVVRHLSQIEPS